MSDMEKKELFSIVCFAVLMEGNGGILNKHPNYISEKWRLFTAGPYLFNALDNHNQKKVVEWGKRWKVDFESYVEQMGKDYWDIPGPEFKKKYFIDKRGEES